MKNAICKSFYCYNLNKFIQEETLVTIFDSCSSITGITAQVHPCNDLMKNSLDLQYFKCDVICISKFKLEIYFKTTDIIKLLNIGSLLRLAHSQMS